MTVRQLDNQCWTLAVPGRPGRHYQDVASAADALTAQGPGSGASIAQLGARCWVSGSTDQVHYPTAADAATAGQLKLPA